MTRLEKRLVALSALGIRIEHDSGHRYIMSTPTDYFDIEKLAESARDFDCKIYGGIEEALDRVDNLLIKTGYMPLEEYCDRFLLEWKDYGYTEEDFVNLREEDLS